MISLDKRLSHIESMATKLDEDYDNLPIYDDIHAVVEEIFNLIDDMKLRITAAENQIEIAENILNTNT